jgi:hypothetical protein
MTSRRLLILGLAAILVVGAGVWVAGRQASPPATERGALYPQLKGQLNAISAVRVIKPGGTTAVSLNHASSSEAGGWTVGERSDYPADDAKLRKLLIAIADAKIAEEKTSTPANYSALGVQDISDAAAGGVQIEIDGPAQPVKLIVGKSGNGVQSQYVRRVGEAQSWLISASIDTSSSPDQWVRKQIVDVAADRVQSAAINIGGAKGYTVEKKTRADTAFAVDGLPKGKELSSPNAADGFASALTAVTLSEVSSGSAPTDVQPDRATFKTFDGLVVDATGWKRGDKHYLTVKTSYDATLADRFKVATVPPEEKPAEKKDAAAAGESKEGGKPEAPPQPAAEPAKPAPNVAEEVTTTNAKVGGWIYEIPSYKYEMIFKPADELIKK